MSDVRITLTGQNIPAAKLQKLLEAAVRLGLRVQVDDLSAGAENLASYLRTSQNDRLKLRFPSCFQPYEGVSLGQVSSGVLESFLLMRAHKPFQGCACFHLQTAIINLMLTRGMYFTDSYPALAFRTPLENVRFEARTYNILKREGLVWAEQVGYLSQQDIMAMRAAGKGVVADVQRCLGKQLPARW